jgi:hypothetical protein
MGITKDMIAKSEVGGEIYAVSPPPHSEEECVVAQPCFVCVCFCVCGCGVAQSLARCILLTLSTRTKDHLAHMQRQHVWCALTALAGILSTCTCRISNGLRSCNLVCAPTTAERASRPAHLTKNAALTQLIKRCGASCGNREICTAVCANFTIIHHHRRKCAKRGRCSITCTIMHSDD